MGKRSRQQPDGFGGESLMRLCYEPTRIQTIFTSSKTVLRYWKSYVTACKTTMLFLSLSIHVKDIYILDIKIYIF